MQDTFTHQRTIDEKTRRTLAAELSRYYFELAGADEKPAPRFSLGRALDCMAHPHGLRDGFEKELCSATAMAAGHTHDQHRIRIPLEALATRDLSATNGGASGGYLVGTNVAPEPPVVGRAVGRRDCAAEPDRKPCHPARWHRADCCMGVR